MNHKGAPLSRFTVLILENTVKNYSKQQNTRGGNGKGSQEKQPCQKRRHEQANAFRRAPAGRVHVLLSFHVLMIFHV